MKITLKKGTSSAAPLTSAETIAATPPVESASEAPVDSAGEPAMPAAEEPVSDAAAAPAVSRRKAINIYGIIFAVLGFLAIGVFAALLILQGSEFSFYKAPESLWLK